MEKQKRDTQLHFMVSKDEKEMILEKMSEVGTHNMGAYLRKMSIDGLIIHLDLTDVRELVRLLRVTSNSLNQLTKRANETGNVYQDDIEDLKQSYDKLWTVSEEIMTRLASI
ncbi:MAG: plasmid mobilization relaxosome protein MobC [Eubacteriales bacterium]